MIPIPLMLYLFDAFSEMKFGYVFLVLMSSALLFDATNHRTGMAFRVPTPDVSVVDLTFTAEKADGVGWSRRREHTWELYHWKTWWEKSEKGDILVNDNNAMYFLVIEEFWYTVCTRMCDLMLSRCKSDSGKVLICFFFVNCSAVLQGHLHWGDWCFVEEGHWDLHDALAW